MEASSPQPLFGASCGSFLQKNAGAAFETSRPISPASVGGLRRRPHSGVDDHPGRLLPDFLTSRT